MQATSGHPKTSSVPLNSQVFQKESNKFVSSPLSLPFSSLISSPLVGLERFSVPGVSHFSQFLFDPEHQALLVAAKDHLLRLSIDRLNRTNPQVVYLPATEDAVRSCKQKGQSPLLCHNYIHVLIKGIPRFKQKTQAGSLPEKVNSKDYLDIVEWSNAPRTSKQGGGDDGHDETDDDFVADSPSVRGKIRSSTTTTVAPVEEEAVFVCGSNAFAPVCVWRNLQHIGQTLGDINDGRLKSPFNPLWNTTTLMTKEGKTSSLSQLSSPLMPNNAFDQRFTFAQISLFARINFISTANTLKCVLSSFLLASPLQFSFLSAMEGIRLSPIIHACH